MMYRECPYCGSNLDHNERCDCAGARAEHNSITLKRTDDTRLVKSLNYLKIKKGA